MGKLLDSVSSSLCVIKQRVQKGPKETVAVVDGCFINKPKGMSTCSTTLVDSLVALGSRKTVALLAMAPRYAAQDSCIIEFDGASRGNPGRSGAGVVLRSSHDNSALFYFRQGLGFATNNVAEYRALILGLESALQTGFRNVRVCGDSRLVVMQVQGAWRINHPKLAELCEYAQELMSQFNSVHIQHIDREFNWEADAEANQAINLAEGQIQTAETACARRRGY